MAVPFSGDTPESRNTCLHPGPLSLAELRITGTDRSQMSPQGPLLLGDNVRCGAAFREARGLPLRTPQTLATLATCLLVSRGHSSSGPLVQCPPKVNLNECLRNF